MSQPKSARKARAQARRTKHRETKRRTVTKATTKRQRTRQQTPILWRNRIKGRAIQRSGKRAIKRVLVALPRRLLGLAA